MSDSGRFYVSVQGRTFCIEPIDNNPGKPQIWGDVDPASKKLTGNYGEKNKGSVTEKESIITEENGFKNIQTLAGGVSPIGYIEEIIKQGRL